MGYGTTHHDVFEEWWRYARGAYLAFDDGTPGDMVTLYYDPLIDYHHRVPVMAGGTFPALYLAAQEPDEARALFDAGRRQAGLLEIKGPLLPPGPRGTAMMLLLATEWGIDDLADALSQAADEHYEPTWDAERGEFTWGFGLQEPHPRGQYNAIMAAAQIVTRGAWSRLADHAPGRRFEEPTVTGVDFPTVALSQAWWDTEGSRLVLATVPMNTAVSGRPTTLRIAGLAGLEWEALIDGGPATARWVEGDLEIATTVGEHRIVVQRG